MELYVCVAGNGHDQWKHELEAIKLPYKEKGKEDVLVRLGVGEVKLYKLYFQKENLDAVMSVVGVGKKTGSYALLKNPRLRIAIKWMRKALKLKEAPIPKETVAHMMPNQFKKSVVVIPIGTKEDEIGGDGNEKI